MKVWATAATIFTRQCGAAALDQLKVPVGFVGTIDVIVELVHAVEVIYRNAVGFEALGSGVRAGHRTIEKALVARQSVDKTIGGGASTDANDALVFQRGQQNLDSSLADGLFEFILGHGLVPF